MCRGETFFTRPCPTHPQSPGYQQSPRHESWCAPNSLLHDGCTGEKYFAPTCAIDALSPTRFDRTPAVRRRITDVRAKYFSPLRVPSMSFCPNNKHRHLTSVGRNRHSSPHHECTGEIYFAPTCANDVRSTSVRPGARVGCRATAARALTQDTRLCSPVSVQPIAL